MACAFVPMKANELTPPDTLLSFAAAPGHGIDCLGIPTRQVLVGVAPPNTPSR